MKIEVGESLACSWLRHVRNCWLVQANWKVSEHWKRYAAEEELDELFRDMKGRFDDAGSDGESVFKKTKGAAQLLKQGEIDVLGIDHEGGVHAAEVAYHEAGLHYKEPKAVLKKMLRTLLILRAFRPPNTQLHIYFLSPKVNPAVRQPLEETFADLGTEYPEVEWLFFVNDDFAKTIVRPTLVNASGIADSSELFVRSIKLLDLVEHYPDIGSHSDVRRATSRSSSR